MSGTLPESARLWLARAARSGDDVLCLPLRSASGAAGEHTRALFAAGLVELWNELPMQVAVRLTPEGLALGLTLDVVPR